MLFSSAPMMHTHPINYLSYFFVCGFPIPTRQFSCVSVKRLYLFYCPFGYTYSIYMGWTAQILILSYYVRLILTWRFISVCPITPYWIVTDIKRSNWKSAESFYPWSFLFPVSIVVPHTVSSFIPFTIYIPSSLQWFEAIPNTFMHTIFQECEIVSYAFWLSIQGMAKLTSFILQFISTDLPIRCWSLAFLLVYFNLFFLHSKIPFSILYLTWHYSSQ